MSPADLRDVIVFNGDTYNHLELRGELSVADLDLG